MTTRLHHLLTRLAAFAIFTGQCVLALPSGLLRIGTVWQQLFGVLLGTLPLALVAGAALGVVSWLQIRGLLFRFSSEALLPSALTLAVVRGHWARHRRSHRGGTHRRGPRRRARVTAHL